MTLDHVLAEKGISFSQYDVEKVAGHRSPGRDRRAGHASGARRPVSAGT